MLVGYARVSTQDQNLHLQHDALRQVGCQKIFEDKASGASAQREGLHKALAMLREGDTLVVWKLDRLGRSLKHLVETVQGLQEAGVGFKSLQENLDTTSSGGKLVFHFFAALAEFERDLVRERTNAGLTAARARGRVGGRKPVLTGKKAETALALYNSRTMPVADICKTLGVGRTSLYRLIQASGKVSEVRASQP